MDQIKFLSFRIKVGLS